MCPHPRAILLARKGLLHVYSPPEPRPRDLTPLARVLAHLDALGLDCQPSDPRYSARCPVHRGEKRNFDVIELDRPRMKRDRSILPAGTVLIHCQAYGDSQAPDGCSQERVIEALGVWWCDLSPTAEEPARRDGRLGMPGPWTCPCQSHRCRTIRSRSGRIWPPLTATRLTTRIYPLDSAIKGAGPDPDGQGQRIQQLRLRARSCVAGKSAARSSLAPSWFKRLIVPTEVRPQRLQET
jgi:hypothetical protein